MSARHQVPRLGIPEKVLDNLVETHAHDERARALLKTTVLEIQNAIAIALRFRRTADERRADRERLEGIVEHLRAASETTRKLSPAVRRELQRKMASSLSRLFTDSAFALGAQMPAPEISIRTFEIARKRPPAEAYALLEAETQRFRVECARSFGFDILASTIEAISQLIVDTGKLEKIGKGGRPENEFRPIVIRQLANSFDAISGKAPTTTINGPFARLVVDVMTLFELPTEGLDDAVKRALGKGR